MVLVAVLGGCASAPASSGGGYPGEPSGSLVLEPSPMLALARGEREATELPLAAPDRPDRAERRAAREAEGDATEGEGATEAAAEPPELGEEIEDGGEMEVRTVRVKTTRFATPEDLARYAIRHAESRRPRELYPTRLLVRRAGPVRAEGASRRERRRAAELVEDLRHEIKQCLVQEQSRRPGVVLEVPESLVIQQAARGSDPVAYRFSLSVGPGESATVTRRQGGLSAEGAECIAAAADAGTRGRRLRARVEIPVSAFVQPGFAMAGSGMHSALALEAATLGWLHYEREQYREALAYFRDAYWLFHLVEYQVLIGMALEELGRDEAAADAYAMYLERRPYAAEAPRLREAIARLRADEGP